MFDVLRMPTWRSLSHGTVTILGLRVLGAVGLLLFDSYSRKKCSGPAFTAGQPMMAVLMVGFLVNTATGAQTHLLTLTDHERSCAHIYGWCAALIGLNLGGVYAYGALGAALATATALTVRNLWVRRRGVYPTGLRPSIVALWPTASSHA